MAKVKDKKKVKVKASQNGTGHADPTARFMLVTPEVAGDWLPLNIRNRSLRDNRVRRYAAAMEAGQWDNNGESIKFDWNGYLVDGQHRLAAVILSGTSHLMLVVKGLDPSVFDTIDVGAPRVVGDALYIMGHTNSMHVGAALGMLYRYRLQGTLNRPPNPLLPTIKSLEGLLEQEPGIEQAVPLAVKLAHRLHIGIGTAALLIHLMGEKDEEDAKAFWENVLSGEDLKKDSPIFRLRERLMAKGRLQPTEVMVISIKAWNAWRKGETMQTLFWRQHTEPVPNIE